VHLQAVAMEAQISSLRAQFVQAENQLREKLFLEHPRSLGESYWEHQRYALSFGTSMIVGGVACVVHAVVPALFVSTGSTMIRHLYHRLIATKRIAGVDGH
jgi:hypothetical protein